VSTSAALQLRRLPDLRLPFILAAALGTLAVLFQAVNPAFLCGLIFALVASVYALFRPWPGFLAYLVSIQFVDFVKRVSLAFGNPSMTEWYGIVVVPDLILLASTVGLVLSAQSSPHNSKFRLVERFLWAYASWYTIRSLWTAAPLSNSVAQWKSFIPYLGCFYFGACFIERKARIRSVLSILAVITALASLYALFQVTVGLTGFERRWLFNEHTRLLPGTILYGDDIPRAFSFYSDPWTFGYTTAWVLTLLLFWRKGAVHRLWNSVWIMAVLVLGLLSTVARGTWTLASLGIGVYMWTQVLKTRTRKLIFALVATIIVFFAVDQFESLAESTSPFLARALFTSTYSDRAESFSNLLSRGILGSVIGDGVASAPGSANLAHSGNLGSYLVHDYLTESLLDIGWVGFGLFIAIIVSTVRRPYPEWLGQLAPALVAMVLGIPLMAVLFGGVMLDRATTTLLWLSMGVLCGDVSAAPLESRVGLTTPRGLMENRALLDT